MRKINPSINNSRFWILFALAIKALIFLFLISKTGNLGSAEFVGLLGGDSESYINPIENLLIHNNYDPDYRMPGYGWIYYLIRLLLSVTSAYNLLIVIQFFLAAIAVYFLALSARIAFKSDRLFYLVYFSFLISTYTAIFDIYLLTESFTISASIFGFYFFIRGLEERKNSSLLWSGLFFTWTVFLRPVYLPYFFFGIGFLLHYFRRSTLSIKEIVFSVFIFILPFIVIDSFWTIRNYRVYNKILPITKSVLYPEFEGSFYSDLMRFLQSWGGNYIFWDPTAEIRWFGVRGQQFKNAPSLNDKNISIPSYIYTSRFNEDSLVMIKDMILRVVSKDISTYKRDKVNVEVKTKLNSYTLSIKEEHPFLFHIKSRLIYFKKFLFHSGTYNLFKNPFDKLNFIEKSIKLFYSFEYLFILITGLAGIVLILFQRVIVLQTIFPLVVVYTLILFPLVIRLQEIRYFAPAFPFMLVCSMYVTDKLFAKFKRKKINTIYQ